MKKLTVLVLTILMLTLFAGAATFEYILPTEYQKIEFATFLGTGWRIIAMDKNGNTAMYNHKGEKLSADYDSFSLNTNGIGIARRGDKVFLINYNGKEIEEFGGNYISHDSSYVLLDLGNNNDGRPIFYYQGEFAVCTYDGKVVKTLPYEDYLPSRTAGYGLSFESGRLIFEKDGKYGAINHSFEVVIEPVYDSICGFTNDSYTTVAIKDGKYGIIDYDGNVMTAFEYDYIDPIYDFGSTECFKVQKGDKQGIVAPDGKTVLLELCDYQINQVYANYGLVQVGIDNNRADAEEYPTLYGLIDYNQNVVIPIEHIAIHGIYEGMIPAKKSYDHAGYYDLHGNEITEFKYRMISDFSGGLAFASSYIDDVWTHEVIDNDGNVLFNPENFSTGFRMGIAYVDGKFIDGRGNVVFAPADKKTTSYGTYDSPEKEGFYTVTDGTSYGVVKYTPEKQEALWDYEYIDFYGKLSKISVHSGGYEFLLKDGTHRYFNKEGKETENKVEIYGYNMFAVGDSYELCDNGGNVIFTVKTSECKSVCEAKDYMYVIYSDSVKRFSKESAKADTITFDFEISEIYFADHGGYYYKNANGEYHIDKGDKGYELVLFLGDEYAAKRDGGWYVVDKDGKERNKEPLPLKPEIYIGGENYYVVGSKVLDRDFNFVLDTGTLLIQNFADNKYIICGGEKQNELGVINLKGETLIEYARSNITYLGSDLFYVYKGGLGSIVHGSGRVLVSGCTHITEMGDNGYIGISQDGFEGYIDKNGKVKIVLPHGYYVQGSFSEGMAPVVENIIYSRYGYVSYINEKGEIVLESNGEWCSGGDFENGIAVMGTNLGKAGATGIRIVRCLYDTPSAWAAEGVLEAIDKGILKEEHQNRYKKNISREDFCEIVYELPVVQAAIKDKNVDNILFADTENEKVRALCAVGVIVGTGNGKFTPDAFITRQ
ncbi:MAG: WG repeat-containing protein, partial [Ruminococcaceae bacterium]|nr:WG repeat-containing protein [Oscillospiraceae bacterium]